MTDKTQYSQDSSTSTLTKEERRKIYQKAYSERNKERNRIRSKIHYQQNKEKYKSTQLEWNAKNTEKRRAYMAEYIRDRRQKNPLHNFFCNIRTAGNRVVKQVGLGKKPTNTFKWVGCSPEQLKAHIESLFLEGMNWDNYGKRGWHVDHIRPISSFKPEEWEQINHYTNLQPLWWQDNLSKGDR